MLMLYHLSDCTLLLRPQLAFEMPAHSLTGRTGIVNCDGSTGILDDALTVEVGEAMFARCRSILTVTEAAAGRAECARCRSTAVGLPPTARAAAT